MFLFTHSLPSFADPPMNLYLTLLLLLVTHFPKSFYAQNEKHDACSKRLQCGSLGNLSYPFFDGSTRPAYCGYPGFNIDCQGKTLINISGKDYYLLGVDNYNINVSRTDNWAEACPHSLDNTTMDFSKFSFTSSDQNITFFYACESNTDLYKLSLATKCNFGRSESRVAYYLTQEMMEEYEEFKLFENCETSLLLPILQAKAEEQDHEANLGTLIQAFEAGFELGLTAEIVNPCRQCTGLGGECGYDWDKRKFACYCANGTNDVECEVNSPTEASEPEEKGRNKTPVFIGAGIGALLLVAILLLGGWSLFTRRRRKQLIAQEKARDFFPTPTSSTNGGAPGPVRTPGSNGLTSSQAYTSTPSTNYSQSTASYASSRSDVTRGSTYFGVRVFDYTELQQATSDFHESKELGDGGFGTVYYGVLLDGRQVAVKRLYENSLKRVEQYMNEIEILARLRHTHLVALYGCTSRRSRELLLVYEYIANGTVADHLHGKYAESAFLKWPIRLSIAVETAQALAFLHKSKVIHRDVKTTNILLDNNFHVKVADFGLSRLFPTDMTHLSTAPQGTPGYVDPEYYQCYRLTEKSDVYSFGVVLIELISSKQAVDITRHRHDVNLANMAVDRIQNQALHELVDPRLGYDMDGAVQRMVNMVAELGFRCLQQDRDMRPTMEEVEQTLKGIQLEGSRSEKQEVMDIAVYGDDVGLLRNVTPPLSPEVPRSNSV